MERQPQHCEVVLSVGSQFAVVSPGVQLVYPEIVILQAGAIGIVSSAYERVPRAIHVVRCDEHLHQVDASARRGSGGCKGFVCQGGGSTGGMSIRRITRSAAILK